MFSGDVSHCLRSLLGGERSPLSRSLEAQGAGARPTNQVPLHVRDAHDRIVKGSLDVNNAAEDYPFFLLLENLFLTGFR